MLKTKNEYIQMTIDEFINESITKPTYLNVTSRKICDSKEMLELLEEMKEETFSVEYENEFIRFKLPILLGEIFHYTQGYETEFSIATGKQDICRTDSIWFAGGGKTLRKMILEGDKLTFISDMIDWTSRINIPHTAKNWSQMFFSDKEEKKTSAATLSRETHIPLTGTLPKKKSTLGTDISVDFLPGQVVTIQIDNLEDVIVQKLMTVPLEITEIQTVGDTLRINSHRNCFLEVKGYNGLSVYPGCIAIHTNKEGSVRKPIIQLI